MAIVRTIAHLGQSLGIKVTVEGVETQTQLTLLRAMGCDTMQGYLFSKPVEGGQVRAFLAGQRCIERLREAGSGLTPRRRSPFCAAV
jgi:EAL domain-containing protein (putative c-di-GMP-specific phosphodiesterase class I)